MKKILLTTCLLALAITAWTQTSVIQDDDGQSSIYFFQNDSIALNINVSEKALTFSMVDKDVPVGQNIFFGGQFKVAGKDGKLPVIKNGIANFQVEAGVTATWVGTDTNNYGYATIKAGVSRLELAGLVADTALEVNYTAAINRSLQIGFNEENLFKSDIIFGVAVDIGWTDNVKLIDQYEYRESKITGQSSSNNAAYVQSEVRNVYLKTDFRDDLFFMKPMIDIGYALPDYRILPMLHFRWDLFPNDDVLKTTFSPGVGIYYTEKNQSSKAIFGVQFFYKDWNDAAEKATPKWKRATLNVVMGFKF